MNKGPENSSLVKILNDPNLNQNRTPAPRELLTLRGIMSQNARMSANMTSELSTAKQVLDQIKRREEELSLELECVRSERHAAMQFVELLEVQYKALETQQQQLAGLTHPIRRYPSDVLKIVFEWATILGKRNWCKEATKISQVCRQWRNIAHDTPGLWKDIRIPEWYDEPHIAAFWEWVKPKLRSATPNLTFILWKRDEDDDTVEEEEVALRLMLRASGLSWFTHIGLLRFELPASLTTQLANLGIYHRNQIDQLEVSITDRPRTHHTWDCSQLLQHFPNSTEMIIRSLPGMIASGTQIFGAITTITLIGVSSSSLIANLTRFPNLETLSLAEEDFESDVPDPEIVLPALKVLSIDNFGKLPWSHVYTPQLHTFLAFELDTLDEGVVAFVGRNQSLRYVMLLLSEPPLPGQFKSFALAAPNLENLELSHYSPALCDWESVGLSSPPFPNLREFVHVIEEQPYLDDLEKLIALRFDLLAVGRTNCSPLRPLEKLSVRSGSSMFKQLNWKQLPPLMGYDLTYHQAPKLWDDDWDDCVFSRDGSSQKS